MPLLLGNHDNQRTFSSSWFYGKRKARWLGDSRLGGDRCRQQHDAPKLALAHRRIASLPGGKTSATCLLGGPQSLISWHVVHDVVRCSVELAVEFVAVRRRFPTFPRVHQLARSAREHQFTQKARDELVGPPHVQALQRAEAVLEVAPVLE